MHFGMFTQCRQVKGGGGEAEGRRSELVPCPNCVAYVVVSIGSTFICTIYKLSIAEQSQLILQLTISL